MVLPLALLLCLQVAFAGQWCNPGEVHAKFVGQAIIQWDFRNTNAEELASLTAELKSGDPDVIFTDLELAISGGGGTPTRGTDANNHHDAGPWVLDLLTDAGFNLIAVSNNHAFDLGKEGLIHTIRELESRNISYAGVGHNVQEALRPAWLPTDEAMIGVVSAPTLYRYGGIATETKEGVNAMQLDNNTWTPLEDMHRANHDAIVQAARQTKHLISYHHNHYFERIPGGTDEMIISDWWRNWAHEVIDLGAAVYISHGSTLLHGVEIYKNKLIMYGLGNYFFQTRKGNTAYEAETWESVIADVCLRQNGAVKKVKFIPVVLNAEGTKGVSSVADYVFATPEGQAWFESRGIPHVARNEEGLQILRRLAELSDAVILIDEVAVEAVVDIASSNNKPPKAKRRPRVTNDWTGEKHIRP